MFLGYQNDKIKFYTEEPLNQEFYNLDKVEETDKEYVLDGDCYVLNDDEYKERQAQKERERIAHLFLTGADVERAIYKVKGMDFEDIVAYVTANPVEGLDVKALKIELKANNFYRGKPYVDAIGQLLGFTSEQLDLFFEDGNYEHLLPVEEPTEEVESLKGD